MQMTVYVADAHAHVQRLVSVVKMATMLEECTAEKQRSLVQFLWARGLNAKEDLHAAGFDALVKRWDKCINVGG
jgi:hypothetical protein